MPPESDGRQKRCYIITNCVSVCVCVCFAAAAPNDSGQVYDQEQRCHVEAMSGRMQRDI